MSRQEIDPQAVLQVIVDLVTPKRPNPYRDPWADLEPCAACESTGYIDGPTDVDPYGHTYTSLIPCPCGRVKAAA